MRCGRELTAAVGTSIANSLLAFGAGFFPAPRKTPKYQPNTCIECEWSNFLVNRISQIVNGTLIPLAGALPLRHIVFRQGPWNADLRIPPGQECSNGSLLCIRRGHPGIFHLRFRIFD